MGEGGVKAAGQTMAVVEGKLRAQGAERRGNPPLKGEDERSEAGGCKTNNRFPEIGRLLRRSAPGRNEVQ